MSFHAVIYLVFTVPKFHLIGHSLGAHVMGYAGKEVFSLTNQKVGRISSLDPSGPAFTNYSTFVRIDSTDAQFVDIIHTNVPDSTLGIDSKEMSWIWPWDVSLHPACSHNRVREYFNYSLDTCEYVRSQADCGMGYKVGTDCVGEFHFSTKDKSPYC